jgi:O-antigen ligase
MALLIGGAIGVAAGAGAHPAFLIAGAVSPFLLVMVLARPQWAAVLYSVLVYTNGLSLLTEFYGLPPLARFAGALILTSVLAYRLLIKQEALARDEITWWVLAYGALVALGLLYATSPDLVMVNVIVFVRQLITYFVIINTITTRQRLHAGLMAMLAVGMLLSALTIYQSVTGRFESNFGGLAQSFVSGITESEGAPRPSGTILDPNYYGESLVVLVPLALYLAFGGAGLLARTLGVAAATMLSLAIIFTYSRGEALALLAILILAALYKRTRPIYWIGALVAVLVLLPLLPQNYTERLTTVIQTLQGNTETIYNEESIRGRAAALEAGINMFVDHPLVGVGRENFKLHELEYLQGSSLPLQSQGIPPHDLYLEVAAEHGIAGIVIVGGLLFMVGRALYEARRRFVAIADRPMAELSAWMSIAFGSLLISRLFLHGAYPDIIWLQISFIVALRQIARAETGGHQ